MEFLGELVLAVSQWVRAHALDVVIALSTAATALATWRIWRAGGVDCVLKMEPLPGQSYKDTKEFGVVLVMTNRSAFPVRVVECGVELLDGRRLNYLVQMKNGPEGITIPARDRIRLEPAWPSSQERHFEKDVAKLYGSLADGTLIQESSRWMRLRRTVESYFRRTTRTK